MLKNVLDDRTLFSQDIWNLMTEDELFKNMYMMLNKMSSLK